MPRQRKAAGELARALEDSPRPIYLIDGRRTILFCNSACADWVAVPAEALVGQTCHYQAPADDRAPAAVAARLCPTPEALDGRACRGLVSAVRADAQLVFRHAEFLPLAEGDEPGAVLVVVEPADLEPDAQSAAADNADGVAVDGGAVDDAAACHAQLVRLRHRFAGRYGLDRLLGPSAAAARVRAQVQLAAAAPANVLVLGPAGSGKQHVAKAIHYRQPAESAGSLVPVACSALDGETLMATLKSLLAKAGGPRAQPLTLLLVDVDRIAFDLQPQVRDLLKAAHAARAIALSCRPVAELAAAGAFHAELLALLSTLTIELVPLAERIEDLPLLAQMFLEEINGEGGRQLAGFTPEALDALAGYAWPGNLDELAQAVREAQAQAASGLIGPRDLPKRIHLAADAARWQRRSDEPIDLVDTLERIETELVTRALERAKGNKSRAAELLGLTRPKLYRRLVQLGLTADDGTPAESGSLDQASDDEPVQGESAKEDPAKEDPAREDTVQFEELE